MKAQRVNRALISAMTLFVGMAAAQEKVVLGGAGSMIPLTKELVSAFQAKNPGSQLELISTTMGSTGGINALATGKVTIALAARALKDEEKAKNALRPLGRAPVVFAAGKDVTVAGLTSPQVCDLFSGKAKSWKDVGGSDLKVAVLTRNEDDGTKEAVRKHVGCFKDLKESPEASVLIRSSAMLSGLRSQPGAIGITEFDTVEDAKGAFKALALDGVAASPDTVRSGKYKLVKDYAFVTQGEPQGLAKRFLDFASSAEGAKVLAANGVVPAR
jgi:phosphate transport system substrate-binding protein